MEDPLILISKLSCWNKQRIIIIFILILGISWFSFPLIGYSIDDNVYKPLKKFSGMKVNTKIYVKPDNENQDTCKTNFWPRTPLLPKVVHTERINPPDCTQFYIVGTSGGQLGNHICQTFDLFYLWHIFGIRVAITKDVEVALNKVFLNVRIPTTTEQASCYPPPTKTYHSFETLVADVWKSYNKSLDLGQSIQMKEVNVSTEVTAEGQLVNILKENIYLWENYVPIDMMLEMRQEARKLFTFRPELLKKGRQIISDILRGRGLERDQVVVVTCHVRRTDYKTVTPHLPSNYFKRAFQFFRERLNPVLFFVVSDDPVWVKKNLIEIDVVFAGTNEKNNPGQDLALISLGDHTIVSHGSFSFSGALLGHGDLILYPGMKKPSHTKQQESFRCSRTGNVVPISTLN